MKSFATIALIAAALFWSPPLYATDLAQGYHLWEVRAPNGTKSYIAAAGAPTDERGVKLLNKQLEAAASVRRMAIFNNHHDLTIRSGEWNKRAEEALSEDLLATLEAELGPSIQAIFGSNASHVRRFKLESIRILLYSSPGQFYAKGHSPTEKALSAFQRERAGVLTLKPVTSGDLLDAIGKAREMETRTPAEIISAVLRDRLANGPVADRNAEAFLAGDWRQLRAIAPAAWLAFLGFESNALHDLEFRSTEDLVDMLFSPLSETPTLVMISASELAREPDLFSVFKQRGFEIEPVTLPGTAPSTAKVRGAG